MLRKFLPLAAVTFTMFTAPAYAAVVYDFTFDDSANNGGIVDGTVTLPSSADGTYRATSVVVTSNTGGTFPGVGLGQYVGNPSDNSFVISGGNITATSKFLTFGNSNSSPNVVCCSLSFAATLGVLTGGLGDQPNGVVGFIENPVTFTLQQATAATLATPLPAALPLFATGLGALGLLGWRRKRKARADI